jgi:antitoxin ParD1/3/4
MPTRNIVLTDHHAEFIERPVASGEVLLKGLRLVENRESEEKACLTALREAACVGIADVEGGRVRDFQSIVDLRTHLNGLALARVRAR